MNFPRYPKYKDSGVEWLGEVPVSWSVAPFKRQIARNDGGVWGDDPDGISDTIVLRSTDQTVDGRWQLDNAASRKLSASDIDGALLDEGDLLLTKSSGSSLHIGKTTLVTSEIAEMRCCYSNFMQRIRTKTTFLPKLAWYFLNNRLARQQLDLVSNSTTGLANLNATMVGQIVVIVPPLPEQIAIAEFLDRETAKIDELVAEQRRLMELLKEKRQAVISHAVTKGLNPHAPMKPSGIEWLGEVPSHWEIWKMTHAFKKIGSGTTPKTDRREYYENGNNPWINTGDLNDGYLSESENKITDLALSDHSTLRTYSVDSVVIAMYGATIGKLGILKIPATVNQACCVFTGVKEIEYKFLFYWLYAFRPIIISLASGGGQPNINQDTLRAICVASPDLNEQKAIVEIIDVETAKNDALIAEAKRTIDLLQERRTALISAAVTGQIDVRNSLRN